MIILPRYSGRRGGNGAGLILLSQIAQHTSWMRSAHGVRPHLPGLHAGACFGVLVETVSSAD